MFPYSWLLEAQSMIEPYILHTPLTYDADLDIYLKWENQQRTGSFKLRGAYHKILALQDWERERGVVAASAGNHGQGLAYAAKSQKIPVTIFSAENSARNKIEAMRSYGAQVILVPGGYHEAEEAGIAFSRETQATWVSPYNDSQVIAGQGTIALETLKQNPDTRNFAWIVPVGGGGLISGVGAGIKCNPSDKPGSSFRLVGVQSEASAFMHALFHSGSQAGMRDDPSLADGLTGAVQERSITTPLVQGLVDDMILVSEEEIANGIRFAWEKYKTKIEGSAAVTIAAVISGKITLRPAVLIITGANIDNQVFVDIMQTRSNDWD